MTALISREIQLASRPRGAPTPENFRLVRVAVREPGEGQVQVRNLFMSVDPYMRGRMNDVKSYAPPFALDATLEGGAVGEVIVSRAPGFAAGDIVVSSAGWREAFVAPAKALRAVDRNVPAVSVYLGVLGMTGFTAWVGLNLVDVKKGDRVFVSAAAGATGSVAGQLAKLRGCTVIGSAGGADKVKLLTEVFGFDAAFDYKGGDLDAKLKAAAPEGIDVFFDNVGGEQLEAALSAMRVFGRIIACGAISQYNAEAPTPGPRNLALVVGKRLTIKGFIVTDAYDTFPTFLAEVTPHVRSGAIQSRETVVEGIEAAPQAFIDLLRGANTGKMLVKLA